ncbi:MAG: ATP phosphoribosyltransferase [Ilumatobacteraceae bacterium]
MLRLVVPKGSLEKATLELFEAADLPIRRSSSVDYKASIDDPRIAEVRILRPQEIPEYVAEGLFDLGITGRDWVEETESDVESLGELRYSKATSDPVKVVVAVAGDSPAQSVADLPQGVRVSTEYPGLTRRFFAARGIEADVRLSYGASEAKIPDIADCIVHHRDRTCATRGRTAGDRHHARELHRSDRSPSVVRRSDQTSCDEPTHDPSSRDTGRPRQGARQVERGVG